VHARIGSTRRRMLWTALAIVVLAPGLIAVARDRIATLVSGKRLERSGGVVRDVSSRPTTKERSQDASSARRARARDGARRARVESRAKRDGSADRRHSRRRGCKGIPVNPGANLQSAIDAAPAGAKLCLRRGVFRTSVPIVPKDGQTLAGAGRARTSVTTSSAPTVIDAKSTTGVTIKRMDISGAVGSEACKPSCGRGLAPGHDTLIAWVRSHHNAITGIGGSEGGLLIMESELDHNGGDHFVGCCASGVKTGTAFTIIDSHIHDNVGVGVWCDMGCSGSTFEVFGNVIVNNSMGGVRYEISSVPAVIARNQVQSNNLAEAGGHGGIEINSSRNVTVQANTLGGNKGPGVIANGNRSPGIGNVDVLSNVMRGDEVAGCGDGVSCSGNK
jgi:hypothetical protein